MAISPRDGLALVIVVGAAVASVVVWDYGQVDIGMTLEVDTHGVTDRTGVIVADVTPDGNAERSEFHPLAQIIDLTTVDGAEIERGEPLNQEVTGYDAPEVMVWEHLFPISGEVTVLEESHRPPIEAVDSARITTAISGYVDPESGVVSIFAYIERAYLEFLLRQSIWVATLGVAVGAAIWRLLAHGIAGAVGREYALLLGAATATPFLLLPVVQVGTPIGIYAGYLVPATLALLLGVSLARSHPERTWVGTGYAAALVAAGLACVFVVRHMTSAALAPDDRGAILAVVASIAVVPAAILATTRSMRFRERASHLSLAAMPAAALTLITPSTPDPVLPIALMSGLLGWQLLPVGRTVAVIRAAFGELRPTRPGAAGANPAAAAWRDRLTLGLFGIVVVAALFQMNTWAVVIGVGLAAAVGFAIRRGFLGPSWTDAAMPLAAAVGIPVTALAFDAWNYGDYTEHLGWASAATGFAALSVAHLLASRHSDPTWRWRLFLVAGSLVAVIIILGAWHTTLALVLAAFVPLIPGLPAAFAEEPGETRALTSRLETLAVALTPGAAATVLVSETNGILLGAWLVAVVVWRQFTLNPLMLIARRTQLQRDLAVGAAETERARLAADLHDDALQQLTMLVRTLDEGGQKEAANEAREIATKLRSMVGDLRLPILDDLGAGAALEWLVERVEPLAGGPVKLERSDETRPPANVELAIFRVAQEALTNAIKHGRPPIAVRYDVRTDGRVTLAIDDAGEGIGSDAAEEAPRQGHFGLANMQQRAEQIGALLHVRRWPAGGTRVALEWRPQ
jgi:signal transduction histidine kinase